MSYYSYHSQAKKLIKEKHLTQAKIVKKHNEISPALVLYFDNHKPMPIRFYRWVEYFQIIDSTKITEEL